MVIRVTYTALQLAKKVLSETNIPMSGESIWEYAKEKGYDKESSLSGKTPWRTIQAQMYVDIRDNLNSVFQQFSKRPVTFGLKGGKYAKNQVLVEKHKADFIERDLHPLLVAFVAGDSRFFGNTKTIHHENSTKGGKNSEKWLHPDLVSVHFPFQELDPKTVEFGSNSGQIGVDLFSFEMKIDVTGSNVREYYFQAVSNSSWANEGYLVAVHYTEDALDQLSRLNSSFGIGVIRLDPIDIHQSEIIFPSRVNENIDLGMVDDLLKKNKDFKQFISSINDAMKTGRIMYQDYDSVKSDEDLCKYIKEHKIGEKEM